MAAPELQITRHEMGFYHPDCDGPHVRVFFSVVCVATLCTLNLTLFLCYCLTFGMYIFKWIPIWCVDWAQVPFKKDVPVACAHMYTIHTHVHAYIYIYIHACIHIHIHMHACMYTYTCMHACIYVYICIYIYICSCTCTHAFAQCTCVCVCVQMFYL